MTKFDVKENSVEILWKDRKKIKAGISLEEDSINPQIVASFDSLEKAKEDMKKRKTSIREMSGNLGIYYLVIEYCIEENSYDDDGEWTEGGDIWEFSKIAIELVEKPSYETLALFDNMRDAEEALGDYDGENEVYLSF